MEKAVHELITTLDQQITFDEITHIERIRPWLVLYDNPTGSVKLSIMDSSATTTYAYKTQSVADMISAGDATVATQYNHGLISFIFDSVVHLQPGDYIVRLEASTGYTFASSKFIGWVSDSDDPIGELGYTSTGGLTTPLTMEIYSYNNVRN